MIGILITVTALKLEGSWGVMDDVKESHGGHKHYSRLMAGEEYVLGRTGGGGGGQRLAEELYGETIGEGRLLEGPYGDRRLCYADHTASGRALSSVEHFISSVVLPLYANTHSTSSLSGHQTSLFRHEARLLIKRGLNANFSHGNDKDCLLFHGSGSTAALNLLLRTLGLHQPDADAVVFVGPFEHHSNLLPWREAVGCQVVVIPSLNPDRGEGPLDLAALERALIDHRHRKIRIGSFSAASNVTGLLSDVQAIASLLHAHGALAFFDYATAAPYVKMDMNPQGVHREAYADAIFLSPHKFLGGPGSPGILVVKKRLLRDSHIPANPGGGTVFFVTDDSARYLRKAEERHEGGTPDIIGSIRAALAFQVKASVGEDWILEREKQLLERALLKLKANPHIVLLSDYSLPSLPIFSFVVQHFSGRMLHYNFVCVLLNDLFGIQLRGGCMCAGPFAERLLGMSQELAKEYEQALVADDDSEILRPGFARFSLHYTMSDETVDFVLRAVDWVATHGWKLLPDYAYERNTGEFYHPSMKKFPGRRWLGDLDFSSGKARFDDDLHLPAQEHSRESYFDDANALLKRKKTEKRSQLSLVPGTEHLRWFLLPQEAASLLVDHHQGEVATKILDLSNSPLRTWRFAHYAGGDSSAKAATVSSSLAPVSSSAVSDLDDMFGVMEEEDYEKTNQIMATALQQAQGDQQQQQDASADGLTCELRPGAFREPGELAAAVVEKPLTGVHWHVPDKKRIWQKTRQAIFDYDMIRPGDKVLVCVSGGKDSLSLLHTLHYLRGRLGFEGGFEMGAVTVDPMTVSFDPRPLIPYMAALGVTYHYEQQPVIDAAKDANASSICSWCSRMKRGIIYSTARRHGYNVVAMGQHLDDMAESFMMSFWLNGKLRTQKACYMVDEGDLRFIRPFVWVREADLKAFALEKKLPVISETCPACFSEPKERARLKTLLENQEAIYPQMYSSMCSAMDPLFRNTPITQADHERKEALDYKMGKGRRMAPTLLRTGVIFAAGILFSAILFGKHK